MHCAILCRNSNIYTFIYIIYNIIGLFHILKPCLEINMDCLSQICKCTEICTIFQAWEKVNHLTDFYHIKPKCSWFPSHTCYHLPFLTFFEVSLCYIISICRWKSVTSSRCNSLPSCFLKCLLILRKHIICFF